MYGHMACHGCRIMLMFPIGAHVVKCSVCHCITPVTADNVTYEAPQPPASSGHAHQQQQQQAPVMAKPTQTVVVENPPTVDDKGNEVRALQKKHASLHGLCTLASWMRASQLDADGRQVHT